MTDLEKYTKVEYPNITFSELTAGAKNRVYYSIGFSIWKTKRAADEVKKHVDDWAESCKL
jgi:hypothetical protein